MPDWKRLGIAVLKTIAFIVFWAIALVFAVFLKTIAFIVFWAIALVFAVFHFSIFMAIMIILLAGLLTVMFYQR